MVILREIFPGKHLAQRGLPAHDMAHRLGRDLERAAQAGIGHMHRCLAQGEALIQRRRLARCCAVKAVPESSLRQRVGGAATRGANERAVGLGPPQRRPTGYCGCRWRQSGTVRVVTGRVGCAHRGWCATELTFESLGAVESRSSRSAVEDLPWHTRWV